MQSTLGLTQQLIIEDEGMKVSDSSDELKDGKMSSSSDFNGSFGEDSAPVASARDESFSNYGGSESMTGFEEDLPSHEGGGLVQPPPAEVISDGGEVVDDGPILPPLAEEGFALREWRRQNAIRLEEKERREKEMVKQIIQEADKYKEEYYKKWKTRCENSRAVNREKETLFLESREKFHAGVDKNYWKAIAELIPKEIPVLEKKGKKDKENKPSIVVIQGPKPGKPTDLSRMRHVLVKLKHNPPGHMMPFVPEPGKDAKTQDTPAVASSASLLRTLSKDQDASGIAK